MINLDIKRPKRLSKRINPLTEETTICVGVALAGAWVIGMMCYHIMILPFIK